MRIGLSNEEYAGVLNRIAQNWSPHTLPSRAKAPVVSFSFDDFPRSAAIVGGDILSRFRIKATYFVSGGLARSDAHGLEYFTENDLIEVAKSGHEIGCHTFGHISLRATRRTEIERDLSRNKEFVRGILGDYTMSSFAYPFGHVSIGSKTLLSRHFSICRGIQSGVNKGGIDFGQLRAIELSAALDFNRVPKLLDALMVNKGWVIFFTHDISKEPSRFGCTPAQFSNLVHEVATRGLEVLPVKNAVGKIRF